MGNTTYEDLVEVLSQLASICEDLPEKDQLAETAFEYIGDYPLYAATSNITTGEAIAISTILAQQDLRKWKEEENERNNF